MLADSQALITFAERIRECQLDQYGIHVPQIAVVGAQSSGKSSVLESLTGIPFPRDATLCTRGPTEVRLKMCQEDEQQGIQISCERSTIQPRLFQPGEEQTEQFADALRKFASDLMRTSRSNFTNEVITIEVHRCNQVPFTVIDLPGYFQRVDEDNEEEKVDCDMVHEINERYISQAATIILHVVPGNQDPKTLESWKVCNRADKTHERTIHVLTKLDLPSDNKPDWLARIAGVKQDEFSHALAIHALKCRSAAEIDKGMTLAELHQCEQRLISEWISTTERSHGLKPRESHFGQAALVVALSRLLVNRIRANLPSIGNKIREQLDTTNERLEALGEPLDTSTARRKFFNVLSKAVSEGIANLKEGKLLELSTDCELSIWQCVHLLEDNMQARIGGSMVDHLVEERTRCTTPSTVHLNKIQLTEDAKRELVSELSADEQPADFEDRAHQAGLDMTAAVAATTAAAMAASAETPDEETANALLLRETAIAAVAKHLEQRSEHRLPGFLDRGCFKLMVEDIVGRSSKHIQRFCDCGAALIGHVLSAVLSPRSNPVLQGNTAMASLQMHILHAALTEFKACCQELTRLMTWECRKEVVPIRADITIPATAPAGNKVPSAREDAEALIMLLGEYWDQSHRRLADNVAMTFNTAFVVDFLDGSLMQIFDRIDDDELKRVVCESSDMLERRERLNVERSRYEHALQIISDAEVELSM